MTEKQEHTALTADELEALWNEANDPKHRGDIDHFIKASTAFNFAVRNNAPRLIEALRASEWQERRIKALEKMIGGKWFYSEGYDQDMCRDSPEEIIDEMAFRPGERDVVRIDVASPMPSQWYLVERLTEEQQDAADSDDAFKITQYPSEAEARIALENDHG